MRERWMNARSQRCARADGNAMVRPAAAVRQYVILCHLLRLQRRPPASRTEAGCVRSRAIAHTPTIGPSASGMNAKRQPTAADEVGHQVDRDQRQRKAERGLHGQHRAHARAIGELRDRRRELRRVGHDADAPDQAHGNEPAGIAAVEEPDRRGAGARDRHRGDRDRRPAETVGEQSGRDRPDRRRPRSWRTP